MSLKNGFISFLKFILIIAGCALISLAFVWPFWKFSTSAPRAFTLIVLILLTAFLIFVLVKKIRKSKFINTLQFFLNTLFIVLGLVFSIHFILLNFRLLGFIIFFAMIILEIILNHIFKKIKHEKK